ncbi:hypothetical protein D3C84_836060 [compost metagenome]
MLLEETLAEVFEYALVLMMENYTTEEIFRITESDGNDSFMAMNPSQLLNVPKLMPATPSYQQNFSSDFPQAASVPEWMPHPDGLTQKIALDIKVTVGAGLPSNKAFVFQMIDKAFASKAITPQEYRKLLREYASLPIEEQPPQPPMQPGMMPGMMTPGGGAAPPMQNSMIHGLAAGGAPMAPGGGA